jgi:hypothetical protein
MVFYGVSCIVRTGRHEAAAWRQERRNQELINPYQDEKKTRTQTLRENLFCGNDVITSLCWLTAIQHFLVAFSGSLKRPGLRSLIGDLRMGVEPFNTSAYGLLDICRAVEAEIFSYSKNDIHPR